MNSRASLDIFEEMCWFVDPLRLFVKKRLAKSFWGGKHVCQNRCGKLLLRTLLLCSLRGRNSTHTNVIDKDRPFEREIGLSAMSVFKSCSKILRVFRLENNNDGVGSFILHTQEEIVSNLFKLENFSYKVITTL